MCFGVYNVIGPLQAVWGAGDEKFCVVVYALLHIILAAVCEAVFYQRSTDGDKFVVDGLAPGLREGCAKVGLGADRRSNDQGSDE